MHIKNEFLSHKWSEKERGYDEICCNNDNTNEIEDEAAIRAASIGVLKMGCTVRREQAIGALWWGNEIQIAGISKGISEAKD